MSCKMGSAIHRTKRKVSSKGCVVIADAFQLHDFEVSVGIAVAVMIWRVVVVTGTADNDLLGVRGSSF